jgi:hypothetical protein
MLRNDELARQAAVVSGLAAVANLKRDQDLIGWAESQGLAVGVMRSGMWRGQFGNPFKIEPGVDRAEVCRRFSEWLPSQQELMAAVPGLRGRLLVCCCHPLQCHGDELTRLANAAESVVPDDVRRNIRDLRALGVRWGDIAGALKLSVDDCRAAIGLDPLAAPDPAAVLPWHLVGGSGNE